MAIEQLDAQWQRWLAENLARDCDPVELLTILQRNRFSQQAIKSAMGDHYPDLPFALFTDQSGLKHINDEVDYETVANAKISEVDRAQKVDTPHLQLFTLDDFLSADECQQLVHCINSKLRPSTVTVDNGDDLFRTSETCDLCSLDSDIIAEIDQRIADTLGINLSYSEGIQGQRYSVGQEFKPHTDYFEPGTKEFAKFAGTRGQRTWTFMIYLNETEQGGSTHFPNIDQTFKPKKGMAVIWNNLYRSGRVNPDTIHHGTPVEKGFKSIITKWFRDRGSGEMMN